MRLFFTSGYLTIFVRQQERDRHSWLADDGQCNSRRRHRATKVLRGSETRSYLFSGDARMTLPQSQAWYKGMEALHDVARWNARGSRDFKSR